MAIKITPQRQKPAVDLEYVHFDLWEMSITRTSPARIQMSAQVVLYGLDPAGNKRFDTQLHRIDINNIDQYIAGLGPAEQAQAATAMAQIQTGLGILVEINKGWSFDSVE